MTIPPVQQGHAAARSAARESGAGRATARHTTGRYAASFAAGALRRTPARTG
ncbi:hypothetical protein [Caballeronia sp. AZ10_KS36]|uniref:hypothetical protein n=1 Tax=Caballeronia sp. AZ10_KS36 TaxID=2921757 RepID=UPI0020298D23|nr:hypothetical protein [Caballeronia sp. AZ10_KS36]